MFSEVKKRYSDIIIFFQDVSKDVLNSFLFSILLYLSFLSGYVHTNYKIIILLLLLLLLLLSLLLLLLLLVVVVVVAVVVVVLL